MFVDNSSYTLRWALWNSLPALQVDWWDWCKHAFGENAQVKAEMESLKNERDQNLRGEKLLEVYLAVAKLEVRQFMLENHLAMDESDLMALD